MRYRYRSRFGPPCAPPWWPQNEPWPPRASPQWGRQRRFFRRMAIVMAMLMMFGLFGFVTMLWSFAAHAAPAIGSWRGPSPFLVLGGVVAAAVAAATFATVMQRVALPLGGVMDAADRVAGGDYSVRVDEHGPPSMRALARAFNTMTERLQSHDRVRRDLMADVAHELRTPLAVIQGKLEGLLDGVYARDDGQLQQLLDETHVLSRLVEDLRTLALAESGALKLQREPTDLAALARDVVRAFGADAAARRVALTVDAPDDLPSTDVDPVRIREVIGNLLSNALRHTPPNGSVSVRVWQTSNAALAVDVRDTGSGMTADDLARAFDRFYKGPKSRGSGLGLTIARNLVAAHGGEIRASSEVDRGTTIGFTLPLDSSSVGL